MVEVLSGFFRKLAKGWLILALLAIFVPYLLTTVPVVRSFPGGQITSLDAQPFHTPDTAYQTLSAYGSSRSLWIRIYLTWDLINPIMYGLILSILIAWLLERGVRNESPLHSLNLLPVAAALFDLLENLSVVLMLSRYPARMPALAWLSSLFTAGKFLLIAASLAVLLASAGRFLLVRLRPARS